MYHRKGGDKSERWTHVLVILSAYISQHRAGGGQQSEHGRSHMSVVIDHNDVFRLLTVACSLLCLCAALDTPARRKKTAQYDSLCP